MKKIILALVILLPTLAVAKTKNYTLKCMTKMPTTSFYITTQGSEVILKTVHHNGVDYMPIHEGVIVPHDLPYLQSVSEQLTKMGNQNEFRFPVDKCTIDGPGQLSCAQGSTVQLGDRQMRAFYFYTSKVSEKVFGRRFDRTKITLSIQIADFVPVQDISMNYEPNECVMNF
jgi:hypothetical protein